MSSSTISIPTTSTRRRHVDKNPAPSNDAVLATPPPNPTLSNPDPITTLKLENRDAVVKKSTTTTTTRRAGNSGRKPAKPEKSKGARIARVFARNLLALLVLGGVVQIVRKLMEREVDGRRSSEGEGVELNMGDWEGRFAEMDSFMQKTSKMIQVQVDLIDRKLDKHIEGVKEEIGRRDVGFDNKLSEVRRSLEKQFGGSLERLLPREEFEGFVEEYSKGRGKGGVSLEDVRAYAKEVVEKEIEKHAADGLGRVDYALASGGSRVVKHSEAFVRRSGGGFNSMLGMASVSADADKMLTPSFGEPGKCFALQGSSGFVTIRLRTAVVPEAITLEHVEKSVAYDRSSAPKECRISGWLAQAEDLTHATAENEKMVLLSEFTYDLEKRNAQTFRVLDSVGSTVVDTIRFDSMSNHGSSSHTCIYRLRVHGHEPSLSMSAVQP